MPLHSSDNATSSDQDSESDSDTSTDDSSSTSTDSFSHMSAAPFPSKHRKSFDASVHVQNEAVTSHRLSALSPRRLKLFNHWNSNFDRMQSAYSSKLEEWDGFHWYLGLKRFIFALLYFMMTAEEMFVLKHIQKWWIPLPFLLFLVYISLIVINSNERCKNALNGIKHSFYIRSLCLMLFYVLNVLITIAPPMNTLIASSKVHDFGDILDRNMLYNHLMWISFAVAVISMVFIDVVIVHDDDRMNDKYRVETIKLAVVKDEEYILNNQSLWYSVPRRDWGKIDESLKQKKKINGAALSDLEHEQNSYLQQISPVSDDDDESSSNDEEEELSDLSIINHGSDNHPILMDEGNIKRNRCCSKPFSCLQWTLISVFFVSLQLCVVFSICDTKEIEANDVSFPPSE